MRNPYIETFTGILFNVLNPTSDMIDIRDIAHAGSQLCRFTGHTRHHYSVAQHEWLGSYFVPEENALEFLLHDAAESYVNDMSRPLKHMTKMGELYRPIEDKIQILVRKKYGLPKIQTPVIHLVDNMMLLAEKKQLMVGLPEPNDVKEVCINTDVAADVVICEMGPREVELRFLNRFIQLIGEQDGITRRNLQDSNMQFVPKDGNIRTPERFTSDGRCKSVDQDVQDGSNRRPTAIHLL